MKEITEDVFSKFIQALNGILDNVLTDAVLEAVNSCINKVRAGTKKEVAVREIDKELYGELFTGSPSVHDSKKVEFIKKVLLEEIFI